MPGSPQYDHIGAWAVRNGWVGVTITYRLAPEFTWPSGAQDVAAALQWVRENIVAYGGDPARIVVAGHSAGCVHVASYLAGQGGGSLDGIRGAGLLSGFYQIPATDAQRGEPELTSYFGALAVRRGRHAARAAGDRGPADLRDRRARPQVQPVADRRADRRLVRPQGRRPHMAGDLVEGTVHVSQIASVGVDDLALGAQLARFVDRTSRPGDPDRKGW